MLAFSYWMFSSRQLLENHLPPRPTKDSPFMAEHYWYQAFTFKGLFMSGPASLLIITLLLYIVFLVFKGPFLFIANYLFGCW
jgi:hypothetical protein